MPREKYEITVEVLSCIEEEAAIAQAAAHLAEESDMAQLDQDSMHVRSAVVRTDADGPISVTLTMDISIIHIYAIEDFENELNSISRVINYTHNPHQ
jgi:hypothetical protein